jgi:hypothetical protein
MRDDQDSDSEYEEKPEPRRPARPRSRLWPVILVAAVVSAVVTVGLNLLLVPSGVGWRKLEHEGQAVVHGVNQPLKIHYPSSFSKPPSLFIEPVQNGNWFYRIAEQTESYFVIVNTTVDAHTEEPKHLGIRWKASGGRW